MPARRGGPAFSEVPAAAGARVRRMDAAFILKLDARGDLTLARRVGLAADAAEVGGGDVRHRRAENDAVERVEELAAQHQAGALGELDAAHEAEGLVVGVRR